MALRGCAVGLCLVLTQAAVAADPPKKLKVPTATAAKPSPVSGRKQLEAKLQMPAKLNFADRKRVTVREVLDQLHQQHQLSLRFDTPTLTGMLDVSSGATGANSPPNGYYPPQTAVYQTGATGWRSQQPACEHSPQTAGYQTGATGVSPAGYMIPFGVLQPFSFSPIASGPCQVACPGSSALNPSSRVPANAIASATPAAVVAEDEVDDSSPTAAVPANVPGGGTLSGGKLIPLSPTAVAPANVPGPASLAPTATPGTKSEVMRQLELLYQQDGRKLPEALQETETKLPPAIDAAEAPPAKPANLQEMLAELLDTEIDVQTLDLSRVSIATVLRQALDIAPIDCEISGLPILFTNAGLLDYLVEDDGLLITTRMKALTTKETRVYSIKHLTDLPPEQLAKTIRQSIRPWSWRAQINDLGDQLKGSPLPTETLTSILKTGIQLTGAEVSVTPIDEGSTEPKKMSAIEEARQMEMLGSAIANGLVTLAQSTLLAMEMVHYAEPPTGTIQTLGTKLVITQSQAAHREIVDLLKQLAEE